MSTYYNENDPFCVAWLRELIKRKAIPDGEVDERSITDVSADDVAGFTHCHWFAGIGGWAYAFQLAGWPDDAPAWTGSCPCQPFSVIGRHRGERDSRHLWPVWCDLIDDGKPSVVFGEQVAGAAGRAWLSGIRVDLERLGYAVGAADLCAACVGSPHRRQRLYWLADASVARLEGFAGHGDDVDEQGRIEAEPDRSVAATGAAVSDAAGLDALRVLRRFPLHDPRRTRVRLPLSADRSLDENGSVWSRFEHVACADGWRRVESGSFPLAYGLPGRVGILRGYGNAIVPQVAAAFINAYLDCWG